MKNQTILTAAIFILNSDSSKKYQETNVQAIARLSQLRDSIPADTERRRNNIKKLNEVILSLQESLTEKEHFDRMKSK